MIRASGQARRTSTAARSPSSVWLGGIRTSTTPTSGRCSSVAATYDGPSPTAATTSWPASASSSWSPSRSRRESSATTILIGHSDGEPGGDHGRPARGRAHLEPAVGGQHPLLQPGQAAALGGVRAAHAVVLDADLDAAVLHPDADRGAGGLAVLRDVGERLGDHEVDRGLDVRRQRVGHVDGRLDGHLAAHGQLAERRGEAAVDQQRRGDAARERAQLVDGLAGLEQRGVDGLAGALGVLGQLPPRAAEVHGQPDQPLLRAVVDVALEPAQRRRLGRAGGVPAALDPAYLAAGARRGC